MLNLVFSFCYAIRPALQGPARLLVSVSSRWRIGLFRVRDLESDSEPLDLQNRDWNRYRNRWISRIETGIGIGTVVSPESRLESVSEPSDLQNRDRNWNRYRSKFVVSQVSVSDPNRILGIATFFQKTFTASALSILSTVFFYIWPICISGHVILFYRNVVHMSKVPVL